ncbi:unnamed protein product [Closterium sp. NIES-54]
MALRSSSVLMRSAAASALVAELVDFAVAYRLDYATSLVADSESDCPPSVGGECALGTDVPMLLALEGDPDAPDIPTPRFYAEAITGQSARGDLVVTPTWLHWVVSCWTTLATLGFAPSTIDSSLFLHTDTSMPPFYIAVYVDDLVFAIADIEALALVNSELQKRHTCTDLGELRSYLGLQITRDRARCSITLTQSHMVHQVLQRFGFRYSSPQSTPLPTDHSFSAPPSDEFVELSGPYPELVGVLMYLMTYTRLDLA